MGAADENLKRRRDDEVSVIISKTVLAIVQAVVIALLIGIGSLLFTQSKSLVEIQTKLSSIQSNATRAETAVTNLNAKMDRHIESHASIANGG